MEPVAPARRFGRYLLTEKIGQGGMAQVWMACLSGPGGLHKQVVVKTIHPQLAEQPGYVERFLTEARISAQLSHPNIVRVHDSGMQDGLPFLVLEHLEGHTLQQLMTATSAGAARIPVAVATTIVLELCRALGHAHLFDDGSLLRQSIVHGDVSPSNIMLCRDGAVKLIDFGVARIGGRFARFHNDALIGKCAYLAPEQVAFEPTDGRVDVFAAGIVLHELLTMRRLFAGENDAETIRRVGLAEVAPPSLHNPAVPPALDAVVCKALARDPLARFANAARMAEALEAATAALPPMDRPRLASYLGALRLPTGSTSQPLSVGAHTPTAVTHWQHIAPPEAAVPVRTRRRGRGGWLALVALIACLIAPCEIRSMASAVDVVPIVDVEPVVPVVPVESPSQIAPASPARASAPPPQRWSQAAGPRRHKRRMRTRSLHKGGLVNPFLCDDPSL